MKRFIFSHRLYPMVLSLLVGSMLLYVDPVQAASLPLETLTPVITEAFEAGFHTERPLIANSDSENGDEEGDDDDDDLNILIKD